MRRASSSVLYTSEMRWRLMEIDTEWDRQGVACLKGVEREGCRVPSRVDLRAGRGERMAKGRGGPG